MCQNMCPMEHMHWREHFPEEEHYAKEAVSLLLIWPPRSSGKKMCNHQIPIYTPCETNIKIFALHGELRLPSGSENLVLCRGADRCLHRQYAYSMRNARRVLFGRRLPHALGEEREVVSQLLIPRPCVYSLLLFSTLVHQGLPQRVMQFISARCDL